jgi:hypothetical protein
MNESDLDSTGDDFVLFPIHSLIAAFHNVDSLKEVMRELKKNGFASGDMRSFVGREGMQELDFDGSAHGSMAELLRSLQRIGPDRTYLERYEKYMLDGDSLLMVRVPQEKRKQLAADIMRNHSPHRVTYFGMLVIEEA